LPNQVHRSATMPTAVTDVPQRIVYYFRFVDFFTFVEAELF